MNVMRVDVERAGRARRWFAPWGWIYRPVSVEGVLLVLVALAFCVQVLLAADRVKGDLSRLVRGIVRQM